MLKNCSHLSGQESYYGYTHACIKLHTEAMSWISGAYECWFCMALTSNLKVNSITVCNLYRLWAAYPCLPWSAVAMRVLCRLCSGFPSCRCCISCSSSPSPTAGWRRDHLSSVCEISKCARLKFKVYIWPQVKQASKQAYAHMCNAVPLVYRWVRSGSLRLAHARPNYADDSLGWK